MGRYDSHKNPFSYRMIDWMLRKTQNSVEQLAKSIPMHVQQIEKDFVHASFETKNSIFTMPVVKMPQSFSGYGREPTQMNDLGNAVPSQYYMGSVSGFSGGATPFFPRGNLSTLSYQPSSNMNASNRDYDQHTETGGPNGWIVKVMNQQGMQGNGTQSAGNGGGGGGGGTISATVTRTQQRVMQQRNFMVAAQLKLKPTLMNGSSGGSAGSSGGSAGSSGQSGQQQDPTQYSYDKNGKLTMQSKDQDHIIVLDQQNKHGHFSVAANGKLFHGGDGQTGKYDFVQTKSGTSINVLARIG